MWENHNTGEFYFDNLTEVIVTSHEEIDSVFHAGQVSIMYMRNNIFLRTRHFQFTVIVLCKSRNVVITTKSMFYDFSADRPSIGKRKKSFTQRKKDAKSLLRKNILQGELAQKVVLLKMIK